MDARSARSTPRWVRDVLRMVAWVAAVLFVVAIILALMVLPWGPGFLQDIDLTSPPPGHDAPPTSTHVDPAGRAAP